MQLNPSQASGMTYSQMMQSIESMQLSQVNAQTKSSICSAIIQKKMQKLIELMFSYFSAR
jgi:hypothetical protein